MKKINGKLLSAAVTLYLLSEVNAMLHHPVTCITLIFISINYNQLSIQDNILRSKNSHTVSVKLFNCFFLLFFLFLYKASYSFKWPIYEIRQCK